MDLFTNQAETHPPLEISVGIEYFYALNKTLNLFNIKIPNGELIFSENFFNQIISDRSIEYFQENDTLDWKKAEWNNLLEEDIKKIKFKNIMWQQDKLKMYGKMIPLPRLTSWYGDTGKSYTYSGINSQPNAWNEGLLYIKDKIENVAMVKFNSVLLNWYRDGEDHLSWHADDEKELGINPIIASVNFGETRDFVIRRNDDPLKKIVIPLKHGSLLIMRGQLQHFWQHSVPKRKKVKGSRFNLTFRRIDHEHT